MGEFKHKPARIAIIIAAFIVMLVMFTFNALAAASVGGLFINSTGGISDVFYLEITPSGTTFSIWGLIYAWQVIFIGYGLSTICRKGVDGYLYYAPDIMPCAIYIIYMLNNGLNIAWLFLWDRTVQDVDFLIAGLVVLALIAFSLYCCVGISCYALDKNYSLLQKYDMVREAWMIRFMVQNAHAFYATWTTIATLLNLGSMLTYRAGVEEETSSTVCLSILAFEIVVWFLLDMSVLDKYVRFLFSPYIVVVWALTGSVVKNYQPGRRNPTFAVVLLAIGCAALLVKIIVMTVRGIKCPLYANSTIITPSGEKNAAYQMNEDLEGKK